MPPKKRICLRQTFLPYTSRMASVVPSPPSLADELARAIGRLRRSLNRNVRAATGAAPLPEAQLELLRIVERRPGIRVHDAALALRLAPNTVSTLVHRLAEAGLIEREPDPHDGRVTHLLLSSAAAQRLRRWRDHRHEMLCAELAGLPALELRALSRATPVLEKLAASLDAAWNGSTTLVGAPQGLDGN
jgi:DNA-binding MarR family transcriptional regulator